jgi:hypothetical protein
MLRNGTNMGMPLLFSRGYFSSAGNLLVQQAKELY